MNHEHREPRLDDRLDPIRWVGPRPLVSIITGMIPERLELLYAAMVNIREQTYRPLEHCIAVEGERADTDEAAAAIRAMAMTADGAVGRFLPTRAVGLGRWWSRYLTASTSAVPFQVAQWMSRGELLAWWADDERALEADHVEALVDLLESSGSDFVYPYVRLWDKDRPEQALVIGSDPPRLGQITHCLFRADLLDYRGFTPGVGAATDWDQVRHWMAAGARWAVLDRVTFEHRLDKHGDELDGRSQKRLLMRSLEAVR